MATRRGGLGKGLEALFVENETTEIAPTTLKIGEIEPNRGQPRRDFDETALAELADSIREHGVLQPLLVRPLPGGKYQIVAGERRWRASRMAGLTEVPVIIRDLDEAAAMEVALIENLQRSDLNPMEEALGYQELMERHGYTQEQVAKRVGKSRPAVANALRLLALPEETAALVREGKLSPGHARALLGLPDRTMIAPLAERITREGLSVREAERLVAGCKVTGNAPKGSSQPRSDWGEDSFFREAELAMAESLHRKVKIRAGKDGHGTLTVDFFSKEDLTELARQLCE